MTITAEVCTYADLQRQMREALRAQNPEWIQPDGKSHICDDYDSRFAELLNLFSEGANAASSWQNIKQVMASGQFRSRRRSCSRRRLVGQARHALHPVAKADAHIIRASRRLSSHSFSFWCCSS
jgi:hypothetical protein